MEKILNFSTHRIVISYRIALLSKQSLNYWIFLNKNEKQKNYFRGVEFSRIYGRCFFRQCG